MNDNVNKVKNIRLHILLNITHITIARLMNDNVNKVKNIIMFIIINFPYQPTGFSMSKSFSNIKLSFLAT